MYGGVRCWRVVYGDALCVTWCVVLACILVSFWFVLCCQDVRAGTCWCVLVLCVMRSHVVYRVVLCCPAVFRVAMRCYVDDVGCYGVVFIGVCFMGSDVLVCVVLRCGGSVRVVLCCEGAFCVGACCRMLFAIVMCCIVLFCDGLCCSVFVFAVL